MPDNAFGAVAELAASQHSVFTRRQATQLGISSRRIATAIRAGWLEEVTPTVVRVRASSSTWEQAVSAAVLAGGGWAAASHRTAARLHGLDGFDRCPAVELSIDRAHRWLWTGAVAHHVKALEPCDLVRIDGIRCTGLARTLADLGSVVPADDVGRALTSARRRNVKLGWLRDTAERLHRPGQSGTGILLRHLDAIPFEGQVPASWFEELLARCLDHPSLPSFVLQHSIRDAHGRFVARVDLAFPSVKLGLEAHSREFHFGPQQSEHDEDRDLCAAACGWELLYLGWYATQRPAQVVQRIAEVVAARRAVLRVA